MNLASRLFWTARAVGWDNLPRRLLQAWRIRTGLLRRRLDPSHFSDEAFAAECDTALAASAVNWREKAGRFFTVPSPEALSTVVGDGAWDLAVRRVAQAALDGQYLMFGCRTAPLGWPPNFNRDPIHDIAWPVGEHWTRTARNGPQRHDIKLVWEASRLSAAYYFARAYARSRESVWAEAFWEMLDAWIEQNSPQLTVAWGCGQEMAFRLMAALFGAFATLDSPAATPQRLGRLARLVWQTGRQINININQALMQGNNHPVSEAVCLWSVGVLFEEFPAAQAWRVRGERVLERVLQRQVWADGAYVQHGFNYHRLVMDNLVWACALSRRRCISLPGIVLEALGRLTHWLLEMTEPTSGRVPNYGDNDGSCILPLSCSDYLDYRPVIQASEYAVSGKRCFGPGPWDEKMLWLFGQDSLKAPQEVIRRSAAFAARTGGYYVLRGPNSWAMTRCHTYRNRPTHADSLHVDLWYAGQNLLRDGGSYSYYCDPPWHRWYYGTAAHNTVEVDGENQMLKGPQWLWFYWTRARLIRFETSAEQRVGVFQGEHYGFRRLPGNVVHQRTLCRVGDSYLVIDKLLGHGQHTLVLRWRLCQAPWKLNGDICCGDVVGQPIAIQVLGPSGLRLALNSGKDFPRPEGWESLYYGRNTPQPTLIAQADVSLPACWVTLVQPQPAQITVVKAAQLDAHGPVLLAGASDETLASEVNRLTGGLVRFDPV